MEPIERAFIVWFESNHPDYGDDATKEEIDHYFYKRDICKTAFEAGYIVGCAS